MDVLTHSIEELEELRVPVERRTPYRADKTPHYASLQHMLQQFKCVGFSNGRTVDEDAGTMIFDVDHTGEGDEDKLGRWRNPVQKQRIVSGAVPIGLKVEERPIITDGLCAEPREDDERQ